MSDKQLQAETLVNNAKIITLACVDPDGYPKLSTMLKVENEALNEIILTTYNTSEKAKNFQINPKAGIQFVENYNTVSAIGDITFYHDQETLNKYWNDRFLKSYPGGPTDPKYCIIKLHVKHVKCYFNGEHFEFDV